MLGLPITFQMISQNFMSRAMPRDQKKHEMNSEPQLHIMWARTPCFEKMQMTKSQARLLEVMVSWVMMKMPCLDNQSTTTKMEV